MQYIELIIEACSSENKEILFALLPEYGFDAIEELETSINAYAEHGTVDLEEVKCLLKKMDLKYRHEILQERNWNADWESNFNPVIIPGKVLVRADFHPSQAGFEHELVITPKMSFGTGHHATTKMMMEAMLEMDFKNKRVLDFGTGTGILAILAEKLGAAEVIAIDNDPWSYENAMENIKANQTTHVQVKIGDQIQGLGQFDIVLANINKNILIQYAPVLKKIFVETADLIISGLLSDDYEEICLAYNPIIGENIKRFEHAGWIALAFKKASN